MGYPQLSLDEVRTLRAVSSANLPCHHLTPRTLTALRGLASSKLVELTGDLADPRALRLTPEGHAWLTFYGAL